MVKSECYDGGIVDVDSDNSGGGLGCGSSSGE